MIQFDTVRIVQVETMAKLTISEAIKQSGVARSTFYKKYVNQGLISLSVDEGKKYIDSSELIRVFPSIKIETLINGKSNNTEQAEDVTSYSAEHNENSQLKMEVRFLREALEKAEGDKQWLKDQNTTLLLRLEAPSTINPIIKWWRGLK